MRIALIILAAGASSRMGRFKQLLPWKNTTLLGHVLETARRSDTDHMILVLGAGADKIREMINPEGCELVINKRWEDGLGTSISAGLSYLLAQKPYPDAVLIALADQPFIDTEYLNHIIAQFKKGTNDIVCTDYGSKLGVPAIFGKRYFQELCSLEGDEGAGRLIADHRHSAYGVCPGNKIRDLDTPDDYLSLKNESTNSDS